MTVTGLIVVSAVSMGGIGAVLAAFLAFADRKFKITEDTRIEAVLGILPNTNCGGCGYPGCRMLAEAVVNAKAPANACVAGGNGVARKLAELMGVEPLERRRVLAVVLCKGGAKEAGKMARYTGDRSCTAANLTGGDKSCTYGCLGYGECVDACKFSAMAMNANGLPVVFYDKCVGCGACAKACPRDLIEMHSEGHKLFVYCRNKDKGAASKKVCDVACVACGLCVKDCSVAGGIVLKDNLATVNYALAPQSDESTKRCPTNCILSGIEEQMTMSRFEASERRMAKMIQ